MFTKEFISYEEASLLAKNANITSQRDYIRWRRENNIIKIPYDPRRVYKNKGWISFDKFLDIDFLSFFDARDEILKLNLPNQQAWRDFVASGKKPCNIPSHPHRVYKNKGWVNWMDWLGTNNTVGGKKRTFFVNDNYFKTFTSNMAYILGFFYADGYLEENKNYLSICQQKDDKYILENMLKDMESNNSIHIDKQNLSVFRIYSAEIVKDLKALGGHQTKSFTIRFPKNIPKEFIPDFVRGFFDGDGCITYSENNKSFRTIFVSASKDFIYDLLKTLQNEIYGLSGTILKYEKNSVYSLYFSTNDTRKLGKYMYKNIKENSLYLKRKYEKFMISGEISCEFISYLEALEFIKNNKIINRDDFYKYRKEHNIKNIPAHPEKIYKYSGLISWTTFFGLKHKIRKPK